MNIQKRETRKVREKEKGRTEISKDSDREKKSGKRYT